MRGFLDRQECRTALRFSKSQLREKLEFDSPLFKWIAGYCALVFAILCLAARQTKIAFRLFSRIHSSACSHGTARCVEWIIGLTINSRKKSTRCFSLYKVLREHTELLEPTFQNQKFFDDPKKMLGSMVIVLKSPSSQERGVISILYSYALPLFAKLFDVKQITDNYFLVLEPSWSGYCTLDILCYSQFEGPIFVQAYEPRDREFILNLGLNFVPVPVSNNWWVDHRIFRPLGSLDKDVDAIMVAGWADFKRHHRFFQALRTLRNRGARLRTILVGYPVQKTKAAILREAEYYGVCDQLEIHEWVTQEKVNGLLNRSKVNIIWSRREGVNRAIIEGMFAGVPCILREGFNYGHFYPYVNDFTGCYCSEEELPEKLLWMIANYRRFSPREWVMRHMSCQTATEILTKSIRETAVKSGEVWTRDLSVKVNRLHDMGYWDEKARHRFEPDYQFLTSVIR
jgi:glycosyltransferase involved in cell wall biosynthesis